MPKFRQFPLSDYLDLLKRQSQGFKYERANFVKTRLQILPPVDYADNLSVKWQGKSYWKKMEKSVFLKEAPRKSHLSTRMRRTRSFGFEGEHGFSDPDPMYSSSVSWRHSVSENDFDGDPMARTCFVSRHMGLPPHTGALGDSRPSCNPSLLDRRVPGA